nr:ubiquitin-protein ligase E3C-like [Cherax quadricarinatus]
MGCHRVSQIRRVGGTGAPPVGEAEKRECKQREREADETRITSLIRTYNAEHPTIQAFWQVLRGFDETQKRQLLKFVTSCSHPPLLGFKELQPAFCIQPSGSEDRLPTASTCMNLLKLPEYKSERTLRDKLLYAITSGSGFELS